MTMENKFIISEVKQLTNKSLCCPSTEIKKVRTIFVNNGQSPTKIMKNFGATSPELISYKALIKRSGSSRGFEFKRIGLVSSNNPVLQAVQAVGSTITPGNLSMIRSPIRSSVTRLLTPGIPGVPGMRRGAGDGVSRCPEGYQYGGRFTDNQFSTCGQKLFIIAGPLGAAISLIRRTIARETPSSNIGSTVLGAGQTPANTDVSRAPQIPRVSLPNPAKARAEIEKLVKPLSAVDQPIVRMVRKDGFVLEPVVPASVLRTIPDSRDMEGATYMMSVMSPDLIGKDELGLLSNTGIVRLKYVLPGGHELTLEKIRPLTVGERRKLGRTVNSAIEASNSKDPSARLKMVATETGEGVRYSEKFVGIKNPNEITKDGRQKWATMAFSRRKGKQKPTGAEENVADKTPVMQSSAPLGDDITTLASAVAHIAQGGSLVQISPDILQEAMAKANNIKREKVSDTRTMVSIPNGDKYLEKSNPKKFEAVSQRFVSEVQQHLGLQSPNVLFVGSGDSRKYLTEDSATVSRGGKIDDDLTFRNAPWQDVTRLLVSDLLTDVQNRNPGSVDIAKTDNKVRIVPTSNEGAGLVELSKILITQRTKESIEKLFGASESELYKKYFENLRENQRNLVLQFIATLIKRAREFSFNNFKTKLYSDSKLSSGEKIHLNILEKLYENRLQQLISSNEAINQIVSGK